eukprot:403355281
MEDKKSKTIQSKLKLRELKSIRKSSQSMHKTLGTKSSFHKTNHSSNQQSSQLSVHDRDYKKIQQYEKMFERQFYLEKRKNELRAKKEQRKLLMQQLGTGEDSSKFKSDYGNSKIRTDSQKQQENLFNIEQKSINNQSSQIQREDLSNLKATKEQDGNEVIIEERNTKPNLGNILTQQSQFSQPNTQLIRKYKDKHSIIKKILEEFIGEKLDDDGNIIPKKRGRGRRRKSSIQAEKDKIKQRKMLERQIYRRLQEGELSLESDREIDINQIIKPKQLDRQKKQAAIKNQQQPQQQQKMINELETRLRQEEDDMRDILKDKNWYQKYIQKITKDQESQDRELQKLLQKKQQELLKNQNNNSTLQEYTLEQLQSDEKDYNNNLIIDKNQQEMNSLKYQEAQDIISMTRKLQQEQHLLKNAKQSQESNFQSQQDQQNQRQPNFYPFSNLSQNNQFQERNSQEQYLSQDKIVQVKKRSTYRYLQKMLSIYNNDNQQSNYESKDYLIAEKSKVQKNSGIHYCLVQTADQAKNSLEKVKQQLNKTENFLDELKKLQDLKKELTSQYGIEFEDTVQ